MKKAGVSSVGLLYIYRHIYAHILLFDHYLKNGSALSMKCVFIQASFDWNFFKVYTPNVSLHLASFFPSSLFPEGVAASKSFSVGSSSRWIGKLNPTDLKSAPSGTSSSGQGAFAQSSCRDGKELDG